MAAPTEMGPSRWPVPPLPDLRALATWLGLTSGHLQWFADRRSMERTATDERLRHYHRRWLRKADGSLRLLEAPKKELKDLQRQILHDILDRIPAHDAAHGFRSQHSVRTAAAPHHERAVVMRLDLESFFTSVDVGRVYGIFRLAGYPEPVAHALAGICTTLQGSPRSPALANLSAFGLDRRLDGLARKLDATYTRYADDLIFSGDRHLGRASQPIVALIEEIAHHEGFKVHVLKTRVFTAAQRQTVTGLVVNERSNVPAGTTTGCARSCTTLQRGAQIIESGRTPRLSFALARPHRLFASEVR